MSTPQQITANQANAQKSTGPRTAEGKSASARNAFTHGLSATPESLFANAPAVAEEFRAYEAALRADYGPQVAALEPLFDRWAFAAFQLHRAQSYETRAEMDMANDFGNPDLEKRWMRFTQTRLRLAREAASALKDYHALREFFAKGEAIQKSNATIAEAEERFQRNQGPAPFLEHLKQTNPKRMNDLLDRFQVALAGLKQTNPNPRS
jgi:hypothetical protein